MLFDLEFTLPTDVTSVTHPYLRHQPTLTAQASSQQTPHHPTSNPHRYSIHSV